MQSIFECVGFETGILRETSHRDAPFVKSGDNVNSVPVSRHNFFSFHYSFTLKSYPRG
ncbi:Uncharacterised protein [Klebsiella pneumoniae]|uniref:Uncharacterized protein n=1 Tax=Klebsiella pneumoniae TaxID=573 RepID=A0A2X3I6P4_KLEPN|nr:Uncharacterised protein [Klebsiella pneumoniae]STS60932.1 Uncharacterised protein [Klebsiella pneumoniae]STT94524.1 Uncharacterised protein [Klebsiella pneumoniae]STU27806.1 Uncharacterised protein [Klebsiella pneumoniae]STU30158.1 Uncharacterised protein [Klebsiella pneumoniae]